MPQNINKMTAEEKIDRAMRQEPSVVTMGGRTFRVAPPCFATLIKISGLVSQVPTIEADKYEDKSGIEHVDYVGGALRHAKDMGLLSDIITTAVLGDRSKYPIFSGLLSIPRRIRYAFTRWFVENKATPQELHNLFVEVLANRLQTGFFLNIGISLSAINTTKPTKHEMTAPMP